MKIKINKANLNKFYEKDEKIVQRFYNDYSPLLKFISYSVTMDNYESDDIVMDSFVTVLENRIDIEPEKFLSYLVSVVKNKSINVIRKKRQKYELIDEENIPFFDDKINDNIIEILHKKLNNNEFSVLILRAIYSYSFSDIGIIISKDESSARSLYFRAKNKSKKILKEIGYEK